MPNKVFTSKKMRLLLPGGFATQEDFETPLDPGDFTKRQPLTNPAWHSNIAFRQQYRDCANAYIMKEVITGKIARFNLAFEAPAEIAAGWYYWLAGAGSAAGSITRTTEDRPVLFGLIEGIDGTDEIAKQYDNLAMNTWSVNILKRGKVTFNIEAFGKATGSTVDADWPDCDNTDPVFAKDCALTVGAVSELTDLLEINYTESNNLDTSEEAFDSWDGVDITDWQLGDHTAQLNARYLGTPSAALYAYAEDEDNFGAMALRMGPVGDRLTINAPHVQYRLDDSLIAFVGNKNRSAFQIIGRPSPNNVGLVTSAVYAG